MPDTLSLSGGRFWLILGAVFAAMSLIVLGDTAGKALTQEGVPPLYVAWARFTLGALMALPFCGLHRAEAPLWLHPKVVLRGVLIGCGVASIVTALSTEPLADVFGAFFVGPIVSYILAALFLREPITRWRSALLMMGFAGVLLVVKPGFGAGPGMVFALLAGVFYGTFLAMTRAVAGQYRPRFLVATQLSYAALLLTPVPFFLAAPALTPWLTILFVVSALCSAGGNLLLVLANRQAPASVIAPLIYTQLIAATILGWLAFGDWPDLVAFAGLAVIFLSGILSLRAAQRRDHGSRAS